MAEKTEQATPKKLRDARKKGQVARSQDFPSAFTFIISISATLIMAGFLFSQLASYTTNLFKRIGGDLNLTQRAGGFLAESLFVILYTSLPIAVLTAIIGVLVGFLIVGPVFSSEVSKPDIKRLNPVTNIKNLFKIKTFVELLKSILKIFVAFLLIYSVIYNSLPVIVATAGMPILGITEVFSDFLLKVVIRVGIFFLIVATLDLAFQKHNFMKEMRMEKFEVKQEYKDTEGDPHLKSKRKQTAQEIAYQDGPMSVKNAKALITNPQHIAVAIDYEPSKHKSPKILTMGVGPIAAKMMEVAHQYNVPIMRQVELARTLYQQGSIGMPVPEETFEALAEILHWAQHMKQDETRLFT